MSEKNDVRRHFDSLAGTYDAWKKKNAYYYDQLKGVFRSRIPPGARVIELGCGTADVLASVAPARGVGVDLSAALIAVGRGKYPSLDLRVGDAEDFRSDEQFDFVMMSDLVDHLSDIPAALACAGRLLRPGGRLVIATINPLWEPLLGIAERLHLKMPEGPHCFVPNRMLSGLCALKGMRVLERGAAVLVPKDIPLLSRFANRHLARLRPLDRLCWVQTLVAERPQEEAARAHRSVSIIIPAYNEQGNIEACLRRLPKPTAQTQVVVVNDGSCDRTAEILLRLQQDIPGLTVVTLSRNQGKARAIWEGLGAAQGVYAVILDADMAVAPEDVSLFVEALERGLGDFINGTRLIYQQEKGAMAGLRRNANFVLALIFSRLLGVQITDTLCGTKAFVRTAVQRDDLLQERWGDLGLLAGAVRRGSRIFEVPVRYYRRRQGISKMLFFRDGLSFLRFALKLAFERSKRRSDESGCTKP